MKKAEIKKLNLQDGDIIVLKGWKYDNVVRLHQQLNAITGKKITVMNLDKSITMLSKEEAKAILQKIIAA